MRSLFSTLLMLATLGGCAAPPADQRQPVDLIIRGGMVVTMDGQLRIYQPGYVAVSGNTITAVGELTEADSYLSTTTLIAEGKLVLPGLINGHQHAAMSLMRGQADDLKLMEWLEQYIFPAEADYVDEEFVYWGTLLSILEMIRSGTTTYTDMYYFEDQVAKATAEAGMRGILGQTIIGFPAPDWNSPQEALLATEDFIRRWNDHPLVTAAVAPHSAYTCSKEVLQACQELARRYDVPILIHVSETREEVEQVLEQTGMRPVTYLSSFGFLSPRVVAFHAVWADVDELELLKEAGVGVVHNPDSNMKLAAGVAPVVEMLELGIPVGLGTDGPASNNNLDLFEEMGTMARLHKLQRGDPSVVGAVETLTAATREGALAIGMGDEIGSLEAGKKADVIVVGLDAPSAVPLYDPYSAVVYSIRGNSVETVVIDGEVVLEQGRFTRLDPEQIYAKVREYQKKIGIIGPKQQ